MKTAKKALFFTLAILPLAVVGTIFTCLYQFDSLAPELIEEAVAQIGSMEILLVISVIQSVIYALVCSFFGYILADKIGLIKSFRFEKKQFVNTLVIIVVTGIVFSLDYWTFGNSISMIRESWEATLNMTVVIASVLYGGVVEEIMLRLFVMSLIAFIIWKIFYKKVEKENIPAGVFWTANIVAAVLFAAGHLPATVMAFGELTPMILFRCFLLNGGFGIVFGWIFQKKGIQYAMVAHAGVHMVSKLIWFIFI